MTNIPASTDAKLNENSQAYGVLVIGILAASMAAIFIRLAQAEGVPSSLIAGGRLLIAALILTPIVLKNPQFLQQLKQLSRLDFGLIILSGLFLALHFMSWVTSLEYTSVLIAGVLVTTSPIWVALMEVFILRVNLSRMVIIGLGLAIAGGLIIGLSGGGDFETTRESLYGAFLATLGAVAIAVYWIIGRRLRKTLSLTPYIWSVYGVAALAVCILILLSGTSVTGYSSQGYLWIVACALLPQLLGHSALNYALAYLPATYVSLSTQTEPLISAIMAIFVFKEWPGLAQIIGGIVVLCGVVLATIGKREPDA